MQPHDEQRVDDLRRQLRALGYLDAGVDRFVLGPARSERGPAAIAALASIRVGLLAALLLGPAAAIGIGTRLPGLVTGPRDAAVVALYLAGMFGIAATAFTFAASMLVARLAGSAVVHRARTVSRAGGAAVAVGCLVYLTLWWRSANAEFAWASPVWTLVALLVAVVISLLLGHVVAITTFAVMAARQPIHAGAEPAAASTWRLVAVAGILAFAGAAALLLVAAPSPMKPADAPPLTVVSPGSRVTVVAIDGFDPLVFESLRAAARVPALADALSGGYVRVASDDTRDPARAWTTIATGQPADVHGVQSLETRRVAGLQGTVASGEEHGVGRAIRGATDLLRLTRPSVASGAELRAKTFWEVASDAGLRVVVINWWATWPAGGTGPNVPVILSDRATLRLERGGALDAEIAPAEVYDQLRGEWAAIKQRAGELSAGAPAAADPATTATLRRSAELDALQVALMSRVTQGNPPDLLAIYLPGLDIAQHTLLGGVDSASASEISARLDALKDYYVFLDTLLAEVLEPASDETVVLVTQPGRLSSTSHGIVSVAGSLARKHLEGDVRGVDIAPTVLHALGVPSSREVAGDPQTGLFSPEFVARFPVREVPTYGQRQQRGAVRQGQPLDEEMVERLRSLGYVR